MSERRPGARTHVAAIDQGTTSTRCLIFDRRGRMVAVAQHEHQQYFPRPGWAEHDAAEIWLNTLRVLPEALAQAGLQPSDLAAVGIANQRETTIVWDRATGHPVAPAITWQDTRTSEMVEELNRGPSSALFREVCGLTPAGYFAAPRLRWLLDHTPDLQRRARLGEVAFGTVESWLIWNLTGGPEGGVHVTDVTNASRTMLMDIRTLDWDQRLLDALDIPREILPEIRPNAQVYGTCRVGLPGVPIGGAFGDQQAALFGQACFEAGSAKNTYGTGCFMLLNTGTKAVPSEKGLLTTVAWKIGGVTTYALEGSVFVAGAAVQWLRDGLEAIEASADVEKLMATVDDTDGVYLVPAFVGLGAPYWDPRARGVIVGLTRNTKMAHVARAAVDAMAYQTRDVLEVMQLESGLPLTTLKVDGGAAANAMLLQFQADLLNVTVRRPVVAETTALGAAYLAGLAVGYWQSMDDVAANWALDREFRPSMPKAQSEKLYAGWKRAVGRSLDWES